MTRTRGKPHGTAYNRKHPHQGRRMNGRTLWQAS